MGKVWSHEEFTGAGGAGAGETDEINLLVFIRYGDDRDLRLWRMAPSHCAAVVVTADVASVVTVANMGNSFVLDWPPWGL